MKNRIIAISREFGSGGRTIGKEVAAKLGIPCYDADLIERIAEESGFAKEYIADKGEYASRGNIFSSPYSHSMYYNNFSAQDHLWKVQRKIILDLVEKGSCVIVGRCADYILDGVADCLKVFIHASMAARAERIVTVYGESADAPEKRLRDKDKRRKAYYRFYTDMEWGATQNYHLSLDSGVLGIEKCVSLIAACY